jgi:hypothetical protein
MNQCIASPLHHGGSMRLTISLDDDLYGFVKSLSKSEDLSMSQVVNKPIGVCAAAQGRALPPPSCCSA